MPQLTIRRLRPITELIDVHVGFAPLGRVRLARNPHRLWQRHDGLSYDLQVAVLGKTGYGKSSLVNALTGGTLLETSATEVCTQKGQCLDFALAPEEIFSIADVPGVGEDTEADRRHREFYSDLVQRSDLLLYVLRADQRDYSVDEEFFATVLKDFQERTLIVINQCDKVESLNRMGGLSDEQRQNIDRKVTQVRQSFAKVVDIIPVSVVLSWNLDRLVARMVHALLAHPGVQHHAE